MDILALFLILGGSIQFVAIKYDVSCTFFIDALDPIEKAPFYSYIPFCLYFNNNAQCWQQCNKTDTIVLICTLSRSLQYVSTILYQYVYFYVCDLRK